jgi:hypothetical protein
MPRFIKAEEGPDHSVIYTTEDGKRFQYSGGHWNWRNNNPGNLVSGKVSKRNGAIGKAGGFAVFPDYESGHSALLDSLKNTYGNKNLKKMISSYAPQNENNTKKYLKFLQKQTGVKTDKKIKDFSTEEFEKLWKAIEKYEGKKKGTIKELPIPKQIIGTKKNKKGTITAYQIEELGWITKKEAIQLTRKGEIDAVIATSRSGSIFLRARPDTRLDNNLDNLG